MKKTRSVRPVDSMRFYTKRDKVVLFISTLLLLAFFIALLYPLLYAMVSSFTKGTLPMTLIPGWFSL